MAPVLEQPPRRVVRGAVERLAVVRAEAREAGQVVRPREHVDRVDLDQADAVEEPPDRAAVVPPGLGEALGGERDAPRLGGGDAGARHGREMLRNQALQLLEEAGQRLEVVVEHLGGRDLVGLLVPAGSRALSARKASHTFSAARSLAVSTFLK